MHIHRQTDRINAVTRLTLAVILLGAPFLYVSADQAKNTERLGKIARAFFTTAVIDREPIDRVLILDNGTEQVHYFTELRHMEGQIIKHRWEYQGKTIYTKIFKIKGPRWRVYSSTKIKPEQIGKWTVVVTNSMGWPLKASVFRYVNQSKTGPSPSVVVPVKR